MASANGRGTNGYAAGDDPPPASGLEALRNREAEQGVVGALLLESDAFEGVRGVLAPADFFDDELRSVYEAIVDLADAGKPFDPVSVADELQRRDRLDALGGFAALVELQAAVPHALNARYHAEIVRQKAIARNVVEHAEEMIRRAYSNGHTAEQLLEIAGSGIARVESQANREPEVVNLRPWPDEPAPEVWHGTAGEIVRLVAPHTEADPMAILAQFLVGFGNIVGRGPHWRVEATRHGVNLFTVIVGNSSKARKGTSWDNVLWILSQCDESWSRDQVRNGLSSGEGMIWEIRDPITKRVSIGGDPKLGGGGYEDREVDPGVTDKRALWVESEFGSTLSMLAREGNTLNGVLRQAWDGHPLRVATKNSPARASNPHVSGIMHITTEELSRRLSHNDAANGFANRFLWVCARRSQYLPHGGRIHQVNFAGVLAAVKDAVTFARYEFADGVPVMRDAEANRLWEEVYPTLSEPRPGLLGAVTSRAEAQVMRVATVYALLDLSKYVRAAHLRAALAFWKYCDQSAAYIFGDALGDPDAEKLLGALQDAGEAGLTLTAIRQKVFGNRMDAGGYTAKLRMLFRAGLAHQVEPQSGGRAKVWVASRKG